MYSLLKPLLFRMDPESSHDLTLGQLAWLGKSPLKGLIAQSVPDKPVELMGLRFKNPVGLAAGLDKNGAAIDAFAAMGFGFIEVGTVTPRPQPGNPKPRLFRLPQAQAIINRMGFNNLGVDNLVENVKASNYKGVLGINIGKNKDTPVEEGTNDYLICLDKVYGHASYVTVNISSPNTPGLRSLQYGEAFDELLSSVKARQEKLADQHGRYVPIVVKIAPDMNLEELQSVADCLRRHHLDGVIATNTTLSREGVEGLKHGDEAGGLSGRPVRQKSTETVKNLKAMLAGELPIIGVGGIDSAQSAREKLAAGADLLQIYTGFIYQGPALVKAIVEGIE
ncbi:quinone-dependent dihydroorotate dehydrogenase [Gallaecimonas kandeliae]|uniref:quinone-dependent dihydroorotate dehydrogenase n=1 Tax=Gallaecimonas kandeliae TaxID=3029055 RepID=UPI0026493B69|nr:quinone-dependent dihydroorotate dehydrogenase [Gallaecimonas kandeliae]WKE67365.1 quinone-dependent dihydroorotate dehydrogenase [Gallaecimonas kandeliae]